MKVLIEVRWVLTRKRMTQGGEVVVDVVDVVDIDEEEKLIDVEC